MTRHKVDAVLIDEETLDLQELASACAVPSTWIVERVEAGLLACVSSGGEMRFAGAMAERGYPGRVNAVVELGRGLRREGDLVFEAERVVVQIESVAHHSLLPDIEADIARDDDWVRAGWLVIRVTTREVEYDVDRACDRVVAALRHRRSAA